MSKDHSLQQAFAKQFPDRPWQQCLAPPHRDEHLMVVEKTQANGQKQSVIASDTVKKNEIAFRISNPTKRSIHLLATDGCFFTSADPKRCDCLVFDDQYLCFVELKLDVTSPRQAASKLKNARNQLGATIIFFKNAFNSITQNFWGFDLEAYAVMHTKLYPRQSASRLQIYVGFLEEYGVRLYEKNAKTF